MRIVNFNLVLSCSQAVFFSLFLFSKFVRMIHFSLALFCDTCIFKLLSRQHCLEMYISCRVATRLLARVWNGVELFMTSPYNLRGACIIYMWMWHAHSTMQHCIRVRTHKRHDTAKKGKATPAAIEKYNMEKEYSPLRILSTASCIQHISI